ncbi:MAG: leucine-rich repeat domain-containing protein [Christensenellaceae bacterium]|jgi:hypothetical protein|nr:leucine-rich repeat domain-containing protein [Christensenellaceae bacterium]
MIKNLFRNLNKRGLFALLTSMIALTFIGIVVYASIRYTVDINEVAVSGTDSFYINDTSKYYATLSVPANSTTLSVAVKLSDADNGYSYDKYDLLLYSDGIVASLSSAEKNQAVNVTLSSNNYTICSIIEGVTYTGSDLELTLVNPYTTAVQVDVVVLARQKFVYDTDKIGTVPNRYVVDLFDLEMTNSETFHNINDDPSIPMHRQFYYKNVYFLSDFTIDKTLEINYPGHLNLLYAKITLGASASISHDLEGRFDIDAITGKIDNSNFEFTINTPNAYYSESGSTNTTSPNFVFTNAANYSKISDNVDFLDTNNAALLTTLLNNAVAFVTGSVPYQLLTDFVLPVEYHRYGVKYSYQITDPSDQNNIKDVESVDVSTLRGSDTKTFNLNIKATLGTTTAEGQADLVIVGTNSQSSVNGLKSAYLDLSNKTGIILPKIETDGSIAVDANGNTIFVTKLKQRLEIARVTEEYITNIGSKSDFSVVIDDISELEFEFNGERYARFDLTYQTANPAGYYISFSTDSINPSTNFYKLSDLEFYLTPQTLQLIAGSPIVSITTYNYDGDNNLANNTKAASVNVNFFIDGITLLEQRAYLERYVETKFISAEFNTVDLLRVNVEENAIYSGKTLEVIPYAFDYEEIIYNIYCMSEEDVFSLLDFSLTPEQKIAIFDSIILKGAYVTPIGAPQGDNTYNSAFDFDYATGTMTSKAANFIVLETGQALLMRIDFKYGEGAILPPGVGNYTTFRHFVIPTEGVGGNELLQYLLGDTFAPYFDSLTNGMLIDSVPSTFNGQEEIVVGSAYMFKPLNGAIVIGLDMSIGNSDAVGTFCQIVQPDPTYHPYWWQINIDIDKIPATNSYVLLTAEFYLVLEGDDGEAVNYPLSTQEYTFVIPGIYRCGPGLTFDSRILYERILWATDQNGNFLYDSFIDSGSGNHYLLVNGAKNIVELFEVTTELLKKVPSWDDSMLQVPLNLKGIEVLVNTKGMKFDSLYKIESLLPFSQFTTYELEYLALSNCNLTDAQLLDCYLYSLSALRTLDISRNAGITRIAGSTGLGLDEVYTALFYRSVHTLIADDTNLFTLEGIMRLPEIQVLSVRRTPILMFTPLVELVYLKELHVDWVGGQTYIDTFVRDTDVDNGNYVDPFNLSINIGNYKVNPDISYLYANGLATISDYVTLMDKGVKIYYVPAKDQPEILMEVGEGAYISPSLYEGAIAVNSVYAQRAEYNNILYPGKIHHMQYATDGSKTPLYSASLQIRYVLKEDINNPGNYEAIPFTHYGYLNGNTPAGNAYASNDLNPFDDIIGFSQGQAPADNTKVYLIVRSLYDYDMVYKIVPMVFFNK